jgi:SOS regulatory protein LexA
MDEIDWIKSCNYMELEEYQNTDRIGGMSKKTGDIEGCFSLPVDMFNPSDEYFILKVRGDSMEGARIKDGDWVVIKRQQAAENRDIVAVAIDENATLKRFMKMGDSALLIPENEKYEPIHIRSDQASIIGVAVGIIKRGGN